jgi:hypothetical protein
MHNICNIYIIYIYICIIYLLVFFLKSGLPQSTGDGRWRILRSSMIEHPHYWEPMWWRDLHRDFRWSCGWFCFFHVRGKQLPKTLVERTLTLDPSPLSQLLKAGDDMEDQEIIVLSGLVSGWWTIHTLEINWSNMILHLWTLGVSWDMLNLLCKHNATMKDWPSTIYLFMGILRHHTLLYYISNILVIIIIVIVVWYCLCTT